jgi:hypothetical protein
VKGIWFELDALYGFIGDDLPLGIGRSVNLGADLQALRGGSMIDQIDDDGKAFERFASPVLGDVAEHAMLNLVPLAGSWRQMTDLQDESRFVGKSLERHLP